MLPTLPPTRPFAGHSHVFVVPPQPAPALADADLDFLTALPGLLHGERYALARELGAPITVCERPPDDRAPVWLIGPAALNPCLAALARPPVRRPIHELDREAARLITDVPELADLSGALAGLRSLARYPSGTLPFGHAHTLDEAITRIAIETYDTVPGLRHRIDWARHSARAALDVRAAADPIAAMKRWLAPLGDAHTTIRPARHRLVLPYDATLAADGLRLLHVPAHTELAAAGVHAGDTIVYDHATSLLSTVAAPAHARPLLAAREALSGKAGETRRLEARCGTHRVIVHEAFRPPVGAPVAFSQLSSDTGYLWIGAWIPELGVDDAVIDALIELARLPHIIVDLRGNSGGRLESALAFRDRFLREPIVVGSERTTEPGGRIGPPITLRAEPSDGIHWSGHATFLTNETTFSASERLLLGLRQQPWVRVIGRQTGGGTGRVRRLPLLPGWRLSLTTSIVCEHGGTPLGTRGITPDHIIPNLPEEADHDAILARALRW